MYAVNFNVWSSSLVFDAFLPINTGYVIVVRTKYTMLTRNVFSFERFTKAERELQAAKAFGYGPRKFYVSSQLQREALDEEVKDKEGKEKPPPPQDLAVKAPVEDEKRKIRRVYIAVTSDRGVFLHH